MKKLLFGILVVSSAVYAEKYAVLCGGGDSRDLFAAPDMNHAIAEASESLNKQIKSLGEKSEILHVSDPQSTAHQFSQLDEFLKSQMVYSSASVCVTVKFQGK